MTSIAKYEKNYKEDVHRFVIDFGTSNLRIAFWERVVTFSLMDLTISKEYSVDIIPTIIPNPTDGDVITPSVVFFNKSETIIGHQAKALRSLYPDNVISFIKREIGKEWKKEIDGLVLTPETVLFQMFKFIGTFKYTHHDCFITCPICFSAIERGIIKRAAEGNFESVHLIDEPVAVASYYFKNNILNDKQTIIVYNLGAGFFDAAVISKENGVIKVICADGIPLGGMDWDERIVKILIKKIADARDISPRDIEQDKHTLSDLQQQAELIKKELSDKLITYVKVTIKGKTEVYEISRREFEDNTSDLLKKTLNLTKEMIDLAKAKGIVKIDDFILAGGSSKMPQVMTSVKEKFANVVNKFQCLDDDASIIGAALCPENYEMVATNNYGFSMLDGQCLEFDFIKKQDVLPVTYHKKVLLADLQKHNHLQIFSGNYPTYDIVGDFQLAVPSNGQAIEMLDVNFTCTKENLFLTAELHMNLQNKFIENKDHMKLSVCLPDLDYNEIIGRESESIDLNRNTFYSNEKIYAIDLGTTYSAISCLDKDGKPTVLQNMESATTTPSVVLFQPSDEEGKACEIIVGEIAKEQGCTDPDNVVSFIKQQMGTDWKKEFYGMEFTPQRVSAEILKKLVKDAQDMHQKEVKDVVITCPAYFGDKERNATIAAGKLAGLNVVQLLDEPIAAALHYYGINKSEGDRTAIVYDLGGGTFDVAVISIKNNKYKFVCSDGDHHLGGKRWDERIVELMAKKFAEQVGVEAQDVLNDKETYYELMLTAEKAKMALSLPAGIWKGKVFFGSFKQNIEITREEFNEATKDLLAETEKLTQAMINISKEIGVERINDFLLVGGSTKMPQVMDMVKEIFAPQIENEPKCFEPDVAVVKGAALSGSFVIYRGGGLSPSSDFYCYGIRVFNKSLFNMIQLCDSETSCEKSFIIPEDNVDSILVEVFENKFSGETMSLDKAKKLGYFTFKLPKGSSKGSKIYIEFRIYYNTLYVTIWDELRSTSLREEYHIDNPYSDIIYD